MKFYQHPKYVELVPLWEQYEAYYEGDRDTLIKPHNLWVHEFEYDSVKGGDILRRIRVNRTRYVNFCIAVIQKYISLTFQNKIDFSQVADVFTDVEFADVDGQGNSLEAYVYNQIAKDYFVYGKVIDEVTSDANGRVYLRHWEPEDLTDWQISNVTEDAYVMKYREILPREDLTIEPKMGDFAQHLYYGENGYTVDIYKRNGDDDYSQLHTIIPGLDFVPVVVTETESWVARILPILMSRYNLQSALDNILNYQAHQKIIVAGEFSEGDGLIMNEAGVTFVREGSTVTVIEPANPIALRDRLEAATNDIFKVAFFQHRLLPLDSRAPESALNQYAQKEDLINAIGIAGESIANHTNQVIQMFAKYKGIEIGDAQANFDFEIVIDDQQFLDLAALFMQDIKQYDTWTKEVYKRVVKKMNLDDSDAILNQISTSAAAVTQPMQRPALSLAERVTVGA